MRAREPQHRDQYAQEAAVEGHAAFPQEKYSHRIVQILGELVEQDVTKPPAQHRAEHAEEQYVVEIAHWSSPAAAGS